HAGAVVVPLRWTGAYHGRVDLPQVLAAAAAAGIDLPVRVSDVLGPVGGVVPAPLLAALRRRLDEVAPAGYDAVVLAAAGTRDAGARGTVAAAARELGAALGVPCREAYAAGAAPTPGEAGGGRGGAAGGRPGVGPSGTGQIGRGGSAPKVGPGRGSGRVPPTVR